MDVAVLVPVKDFRQAKARLAPAVDPLDRASLARWMADRVLAASSCPVYVVCDSDEVAVWAESQRAVVIWTPDIGLNAAVAAGATAVAAAGFEHLVVAHSDLPLAADLTRFAHDDAVTLVPDSRSDGTNLLALPTSAIGPSASTAEGDGFRFAYGAGSFRAHVTEADRVGLPHHVVRDDRLAIDVDTVDDMCHPLIIPLLMEVLPAWTPPTNPVSRA